VTGTVIWLVFQVLQNVIYLTVPNYLKGNYPGEVQIVFVQDENARIPAAAPLTLQLQPFSIMLAVLPSRLDTLLPLFFSSLTLELFPEPGDALAQLTLCRLQATCRLLFSFP
jgi:hypothetical protein